MSHLHAYDLRGESQTVGVLPGGTIDAGVISLIADSDGDGLPDDFEVAVGLDAQDPTDADGDLDGDGLNNLDEFRLGTDPTLADTDGDGFSDRDEVIAGTNPLDGSDKPTAPVDLVDLTISPQDGLLVLNTLLPAPFLQLRVTGTLAGGAQVDLSAGVKGTTYQVSPSGIVTVSQDGFVLVQGAGTVTLVVENSGMTAETLLTVEAFEPQVTANVNLPTSPGRLAVQNGIAYVAADPEELGGPSPQTNALMVVDVRDPTSPSVLQTLPDLQIFDVEVRGNLLLAASSDGLEVVSLDDPLTPTPLGRLSISGGAYRLAVDGPLAYLGGSSGVRIVEVADASNPTLLSTIPAPSGDAVPGLDVIAVAEGLLVTCSKGAGIDGPIRVYDVTNPSQPVLAGQVALDPGTDLRGTGTCFAVHEIEIQGQHAHLGLSCGVLTINLADPTNPIVTGITEPRIVNGSVIPIVDATGVESWQDYLIAGDFQRLPDLLPLFRLTDPGDPAFATTVEGVGDVNDFEIEGFFGYAATLFVESPSFSQNILQVVQLARVFETGSIAPQVDILFPLDGDSVVVGESLSVRVRATDNVAVRDIVLESGGAVLETVNGPNLVHPFTAPPDPGTVVLEARARDFAGNTALASPVTVEVAPDPLTTVIGRVVTDSGPVEGATITISAHSTSSAADGTFELVGVPTVPRRVTFEVTTTVGGQSLTGSAANVFLVRGGTTNVGDIQIESQPESVSLDLERTFMQVGSSQQISATGTPAITDASLSLGIADTEIATVTPSTGTGSQLSATLQALELGVTTVTATYSRGATSVTSTATIRVGEILPFPPELSDLIPGDAPFELFVTLLPEVASSLATFEILDESIATVTPQSAAGSSFETVSVNPVAVGDTTLRISYTIQGESIQRDVPISVLPGRITIDGPAEASATRPETFTISAEPAGGTLGVDLSDPTRATLQVTSQTATEIVVEFTGTEVGPVDLVATYSVGTKSVTESFPILIRPLVTVSGPSSLLVGQSGLVTAAVVPPTPGTLTIENGDPFVASFDEGTGQLTALAPGQASLIAILIYDNDLEVAVSDPLFVDVVSPDIQFSGPSEIDFGSPATYTLSGTPAGGVLQASLVPASAGTVQVVSGSGDSIQVQVTAQEVGEFQLVASYSGLTPTAHTEGLSILARPTIVLSGPTAVNTNESIQITATTQPSGDLSFFVDDPSVADINFQTGVLTGASEGTVQVFGEVVVNDVIRTSAPHTVQVNQLPITLVPNPVHVLVGGRLFYTAEVHPFDNFETPITFTLNPDPGPARLENASLQSIDIVGVSPGEVDLTASATVQGNLETTDPRTLTVHEAPILDVVRQTDSGTVSIYDGSFVTGAIALTDQGVVLSLSNTTGSPLTLSITENTTGDPGPTDNFFVLQDTAAIGTGEFFASVEFPVANGTSQRTLAFVPDSETKPGGFLDIQVSVEEPFVQGVTFLANLTIEITPEGSGDPGGDPGGGAPEILTFTGQFDALTVQGFGSITVPHGIQGDLEAVGNGDVDSMRIEEVTVEVDEFGVEVGTPTTSVVAVGLTGTDPPSLLATLAPPVESSAIIRRELTAIPFDTAGDQGISSTSTVTYEPAAELTLEITNLNPLGDLANTVTSEDSNLVIGTVAGEPVKVILTSASEAELLTLYEDEVQIAEEIGPVNRLPALPGTFIDVTMPPGSPFGTRIVLRAESLVDVGGNSVSSSTSNVEVQADNRPEVTNLSVDSAFGVDSGGGVLSDGSIDVSFDFADPDEFEFDLVDTITLRAVSDNGAAGQLDESETRTFAIGSSFGEFHSFTFDASAGMTVDSQVTITATPVDSLGLTGVTASITFRLGDILVP